MLQLSGNFYELPDAVRASLVGVPYQCPTYPLVQYLPVSLNEQGTNQNYGRREGLIRISPVWNVEKDERKRTRAERKRYGNRDYRPPDPWFHVSAESPDDYDLSLRFLPATLELHGAVT